jgi:hypothetical protein
MKLVTVMNNLSTAPFVQLQQFVIAANLKSIKSTTGVLCLNEATWLFDTTKETARIAYETILSEAKQYAVPVLSSPFPGFQDCSLMGASETIASTIRMFLERDTLNH